MEQRELWTGAPAQVSPALESDGFLAVFTERNGGVSDEPRFASLNLSYSSGDDVAKVRENRRLTTEALETGPFAVGGQVHGSRLAAVGSGRAGRGFDGPEGVIPATDGLYTRSRGRALGVATADCVPVILGSAREGRLTVVHAGWRGVAGRIVEKAVALFTDPRSVRAAIGPCAGGCCYEVGEDVVAAVDAGTVGDVVVEKRRGRAYLDLAGTIAGTLGELGVGDVETSGLCTIEESERFFSHRRDGACGRQFAIGMRLP